MPSKQLERRLSSKSSNSKRLSINPNRTRDSDNSSDSDSGPGAVGEDFFTPPPSATKREATEQGSATAPHAPAFAAKVGQQQQQPPPPARPPKPAEMLKQPSASRLPPQQVSPTQHQPPPTHGNPGGLAGRGRSVSSSQHGQQQQQGGKLVILDKDLVEKSIVRQCQYLGDISHVPLAFNINNRSRLLSLIDGSRRQGRLPWVPHNKHNILLAFTAKDIRILDQRGQAVVLRLPLHTVAAVSYFHDDLQHLVAVHAGTESDRAKGIIHIFHFSNQEGAEHTCAIIARSFDLLYTEATMAMLDQSISDEVVSPTKSAGRSSLPRGASLEHYPNISSSLVSDLHDVQKIAAPHMQTPSNAPPPPSILRQTSQTAMATPPSPLATLAPPPALTAPDGVSAQPEGPPAPLHPPSTPTGPSAIAPPQSRPALAQAVGHSRSRRETPGAGLVAVYDSEDESEAEPRHHGRDPVKKQESQAVTEEAVAVVQQYMQVMHSLVNSEELRQFATLVKEYRDRMPIAKFCGKLDALFGEERLFMLPGMRAFIPATDQFYFESFLQEKGASELKIPSHLLVSS